MIREALSMPSMVIILQVRKKAEAIIGMANVQARAVECVGLQVSPMINASTSERDE